MRFDRRVVLSGAMMTALGIVGARAANRPAFNAAAFAAAQDSIEFEKRLRMRYKSSVLEYKAFRDGADSVIIGGPCGDVCMQGLCPRWEERQSNAIRDSFRGAG